MGGGSFLPVSNLNLNDFWTACRMNPKLYEFSYVLLEIILVEKNNQKSIKISGGNIFVYRGYRQKIKFWYVATVLVAELNIYM